MINRRALLKEALSAAADIREQTGFDQFEPADPYVAAAALGVKVVFMAASMEGFYLKGPPGRILLSSARPIPRRAFTCAHELGHHWFEHGSTLDELKEDERSEANKPEEVLANGVAAFLLMPSVGIRGAFSRRGWKIEAASPQQLYTVACEFGVGYLTLLSHIGLTLKEMSESHRNQLEKWSPQKIRRQLLMDDYESFVIADQHTRSRTLDVEKGAAILLPRGSEASGQALKHISTLDNHELFRAVRRGVASVSGLAHSSEIRIMPKPYEGPAQNRFLEDPDEEE